MIRTIQKLVDPEDVDVVLPHEHVLHNIGANVAIISSQKSLEIRIEDLIDYRHAPFAHGGRNMLLQNEDEAFRELERLQRSNSSKQVILVVDVTLPVEGRDLLVNKRLSLAKRLKDVHLLTVSTVETTLMNDIVNSGLSIEDQSERIANMLEAELIYGIKREECVAYPGAIYQQIELSGKKMNAQEQVLIRGLAMAQARTHAPVYLSFSVDEKIEPFNFKDIIREWIKVLTDAGAERRKLVLCHADRYCHGESEGSDLSFLIELLDFGITILFDTIGLLAVSEVLTINPCFAHASQSVEFPNSQYQHLFSDSCLSMRIATLIKAKPHYHLQMLLSTNVQQRIQYRRYGGGGYTYLFEHFKALLLHHGISAAQWKQMVCKNVVDLLSWYIPPKALPTPKSYLQCSICSNYFEPIEGEYFTKFTFTYCNTKCLRHHSRMKFSSLPATS